MSRNKQIEEMALEISSAKNNAESYYCDRVNCENCEYKHCTNSAVAEELYNAGYRKSTDVAEEIFAEIERLIAPNGNYLWQWDLNRLAELKKKYTESEKDNG